MIILDIKYLVQVYALPPTNPFLTGNLRLYTSSLCGGRGEGAEGLRCVKSKVFQQ